MSLNHAAALNLVLHLECVGKGGNKREIVYLLLMDLLHVKYMSSSKFSASFQDIQLNELITDVKTSLLTKWQLPKFGHVEKRSFFFQ